ncbi:DUF1007 family protein [Ramlibacter henchirensis]|uniref:DUF1007 family protein n=1 Tax=Ramlibacter henchirensis TaxID=204072 RepID=UPI001430D7B3|nr:DUF1007 family protein [Ramlibacter henchirensis]
MKRPLAAALLLAAAAARAHPHGQLACHAEVQMDGGALQSLRGTLVMDPAHSAQAIALVRDPDTGSLDPERSGRLAFALKMQMARWNWLFSADADGRPQPLRAGEPQLEVVGEQLQLTVELRADGEPMVGRDWSLRCADPTWYWTTGFAAVPVVRGCGEAGAAAQAGAAAARWSCKD